MSRPGTAALVLAAAALLAVAGARYGRWIPRAAGGSEGDVPVAEVRLRDFVRKVRAEGFLKARVSTVLTAPMITGQSSLKVAWLAPDGVFVHEGDVVVRFDPAQIESELLEGEDQAATVENKAVKSKAENEAKLENLGRDAAIAGKEKEIAASFQSKDAEIWSRRDIIESEIDLSLADERMEFAREAKDSTAKVAEVEGQILALERKKADLMIENSRSGLDSLVIRAPHDGLFVLHREWGDVVKVGETVWPQRPVAEIPRLEEMEAKVYVLEADAGGLAQGKRAEVSPESRPDRVYPGTVRSVAALAMSRNRWSPVQYFEVTLALESSPPELRKPGARVSATLFLEEERDVLVVPREAVFRDEERNRYVWLKAADGFRKKNVEVGPAGIGLAVIRNGLSEGDRVALADPSGVKHEQKKKGAGGSAGRLPEMAR